MFTFSGSMNGENLQLGTDELVHVPKISFQNQNLRKLTEPDFRYFLF